ncbi:hypothetical protein [Arthrobacter crystallopoietes]|uniref:hypothetical protein n=1 Tax=Crystallibacter crystallopoietes TaxID=37928 RepID=UPI0011111AEF|nr:hypothetical protein [Arthrobacter crystallopoietes]
MSRHRRETGIRAQEPYGAWARAWTGALAIAFLNAGLRQAYGPLIGEKRAQQLSCFVLLVLLAPWVRWTESRHPVSTAGGAVKIGLMWAAATVVFEFGLGRYNGDSWQKMAKAYDLAEGQLWGLDVAGIAAYPSAARWWRHRRQRAERQPDPS